MQTQQHRVVHVLQSAFSQQVTRARLEDARLYLACSGGRDSLSMAYACYLLYQAGRLPKLPILLHVHHGWQAANDAWAQSVQAWGMAHGFECRVLFVKLDKTNETQARQARYQALLSQMSAGDVLMLAHHQDDQAETVLLRLINGAGTQGLSAMKVWQRRALSACSEEAIWLWRPWLCVARSFISDFAQRHRLPYVEDVTNTDEAYARGLLRTQILPNLERINPSVRQNIARSAQLIYQSRQMNEQVLVQYQQSLCRHQALPLYRACAVADFFQMPQVFWQAVLHDWVKADEIFAPAQALIERLLTLMQRQDNAHQTELYWQARQQAYVLCCYDGWLYRYHQAVWQALTQPMVCQLTHAGDVQQLRLVAQDVHWSYAVPNNYKIHRESIQLIDNHKKITIGKHSYQGKKLYQKLRLPVWLRSHLYSITVSAPDEEELWLIAPMMCWRLVGDMNGQLQPEQVGEWRDFAPKE